MPPQPQLLTIGEVAGRSGVATSALRYYETLGLVHATRTTGGQRRYHRSVLRRIAFVRVAQQIGLGLDEIAELLSTLPTDHAPSLADWRRVATPWQERIDQRIAELSALREQLTSCIGCGCLSLRKCSLYNRDDEHAREGAGPRRLMRAVEQAHEP